MKPHASDMAACPGLYIHIPFCQRKCPYCAFTSYPVAGHDPAAYLVALHRQAAEVAAHAWAREIRFGSLYLGGGTPTIYEGGELVALLDDCQQRFAFTPDAEITVEANPNTLSAAKLDGLRRAGVNRLSIGVQALSDRLLGQLGRTHSRAQVGESVRLARQAGFANLNLDLIYGLPGQSLDDWQRSLDQVVELAPEHLALYELMIEPGSRFAELAAAGQLVLPDEDEVAAMAELIPTLLDQAGYQRYEISNYARPGYRSRHNLNYWLNGSYLGLGAGAVSCFAGLRLGSVDDPGLFNRLIATGQPPYKDGEALGREASFRESVIMGLRMLDGVAVAPLRARYGLDPLAYYGATLTELVAQGLLEVDADRLRLTPKALPLANQVLSRLV